MLTGNGANLSQGQRQLLAIARAAVADPPVMILDEATSSIDTHTEAIVQRGMDALMTGRTDLCHCAPPVHRAECRRHHGSGSRPHHRARHPRRPDQAQGHLLSVVYRRVGAGLIRLAALGEVQRKPSDRKGARPRCFPGKPGGGAAPFSFCPVGFGREPACPGRCFGQGCCNRQKYND